MPARPAAVGRRAAITATDNGTVRAEDPIQVYQRMSALAAELGAINLAQGVPEPRYDDRWRAAIAAALPGSHFQYTQARGIPELRSAVAAHLGIIDADPVITSGCTESLLIALHVLRSRGCERALWLEPYYSYYPGLARLAGLEHGCVPVDFASGRPLLDLDRLRRALTERGSRSRTVLVLNSPHNPSGLTLEAGQWQRIRELVASTGSTVLIDDVYRDFRYGAAEPPYRDLLADGTTMIAGSLSKSLAATGLRLGWLLASPDVAAAAEAVHMHMSNCAPEFAQRAAITLLTGTTPAELAETTAAYRDKRDVLVPALAAAGFEVVVPDGGHFAMARDAAETDGRPDTTAAAHALAHAVGVVPLPLDTFFEPGSPSRSAWLRFSFAVRADAVAEATRRLAARPRRHA
ncbi:MAG: pyridoxal phosphate-dependent aminotransferase [Catenulispora sp.]|nr:pyridoxal phosphate-dependent aminotransferase [Catenulispora sp.]